MTTKRTSKSSKNKNDKENSNGELAGLRLIERRRHPRFLLTNEQFREKKTGKIYPVYDLSTNGLAVKVEEKLWKEGSIVVGTLNLHPDSIEVSPRLITYYEDRAALKFEALTTYSKEVLIRALSPKRLGISLKLIKEKLPNVDYWYHGVCNTDLIIKNNSAGVIERVELFFSSFYLGYSLSPEKDKTLPKVTTGYCNSFGPQKRELTYLAETPVKIESIEIDHDSALDPVKFDFGKKIIESSALDTRMKNKLLNLFEEGGKIG